MMKNLDKMKKFLPDLKIKEHRIIKMFTRIQKILKKIKPFLNKVNNHQKIQLKKDKNRFQQSILSKKIVIDLLRLQSNNGSI